MPRVLASISLVLVTMLPGLVAGTDAMSQLGFGPGDDVLVAFGHAARVAVSEKLAPGAKPDVPIDAAVVAVVDRVEIDRESGR